MADFSTNNLDSGSLKASPFCFMNGNHPCFNVMTSFSGRHDLENFLKDIQQIQEKATWNA